MSNILAVFCTCSRLGWCRNAGLYCERISLLDLCTFYLFLFTNAASVICQQVYDSSVIPKTDFVDSFKGLSFSSLNYTEILNNRLSQPISAFNEFSPLCSHLQSRTDPLCVYFLEKPAKQTVFPFYTNKKKRLKSRHINYRAHLEHKVDRIGSVSESVPSLHNVETFAPRFEVSNKDSRSNYIVYGDNDLHSEMLHVNDENSNVLLQTYRARNPCIRSQNVWVRDEHDCAVFFVCARNRVAAVLTCPGTDVWSIGVTNCVPVRSVWDDCHRGNYESRGSVSKPIQGENNDRMSYPNKIYEMTSSAPTDFNDSTQLPTNEIMNNIQKDIQYKKGFRRKHNRLTHNEINNSEHDGNHFIGIRASSKVEELVSKSSPNGSLSRVVANAGKHSDHSSSLSRMFNTKKRRKSAWKRKYYDTHIELQHLLPKGTNSPNQETVSIDSHPPLLIKPGRMKRYKFKQALHRHNIKTDNNHDNINFDYKNNFGKLNEKTVDFNLPLYPALSKQHEALENNKRINYDSPVAWWWEDPTNFIPAPVNSREASRSDTNQMSPAAPEASLPRQNRDTNPDCGVSITSMIVGGLPARQGRWPWVVSLQLAWASKHVCGATLIHPRWVVTAAHCVSGPDFNSADEWRAVFWQSGSSQKIDFIAKHPHFLNEGNYPNDIALLRLAKPVDVSGFDVRHACLPNMKQTWEKCWIMGWGEATDNVEMELKELEVHIRKNTDCSARWGWKRILSSHVCVGNGDRGACNGDSGGPLICRLEGYHFLAGVTSWGASGCQTTGYPSVFTRVGHYAEWIRGVIA